MSAVKERVVISDTAGLIAFLKELSSDRAAIAGSYADSYRELSEDPELSDRERDYFTSELERKLGYSESADNPGLFGASDSNDYRFFYCAGSIMPEILTHGLQAREDKIYKSISVECAAELRDRSYLGKLVRMQQNGCPVRMTELTSDPLIALYHACKNKCDVSVFAVPAGEIAGAGSDRALMLSVIPSLDLLTKRRLCEAAVNSLPAGRFQQLKGGSRYLDEAAEELYRRVTDEKPFFKRDIDPADLLRPLFVIPDKTTEKLALRGTAFLMSGLSSDADEAARKLTAERLSVIHPSDPDNLLEELSLLGINGLSMASGMAQIASYFTDLS